MPISYPLSLPAAFHSAQIQITAASVVAVVESPFTLTEQTQESQGQRWMASVKLPLMKRAQAEQVIGTLLKLNGRSGSFYLGDSANKTPLGVATGVPLVNGAQTPYSSDLATKGWTPGVTGILKAGDWLQIGTSSSRRLHKVLEDVNSDGSGNATVLVWPWIRSAYPNNTQVVVTNPTGVFKLRESTSWDIDVVKTYGVSFSANEQVSL